MFPYLVTSLAPIHSSRKSGTTSLPQDLIREPLHSPLATSLLDKSKPQTVWKVVFSTSPSLTATSNPRPKPGDNLNSRSMRLRDSIATQTSTEWIFPEIRHAPWSRNGTPSLRQAFKPRLPMDSSSDCSQSLSLREPRSKWRPHVMLKTPTRSWSLKRWWRLCKQLFKSLLSRSSSKFCKYFFSSIIIYINN